MDTKDIVSTVMEQIATNAKRNPEVGFTSLAHHMNFDWLYEAFESIRKDGAVGIDEITAEDYSTDLKNNLEALLEKAKSGRYKAPAVRRVYIPKAGSNEKRPLGIPTFEDKVLQKAVKWLIEPIYEQDFYDCSYGFRKRRSQHMALDTIWKGIMKMGGSWVIDLDIRKFFDTIQWSQLRDIMKQRVRDGVLIKLIGKWMNAGIMKEGGITYPETGTPQGGIISPILSNIFLHEVLDKWLHETVFPLLRGKAFEVRFADDAVICFENEEDALRVMKALPKRLRKYGLEMHPEKTRLVYFKKPNRKDWEKQGNRTETFNFMGFTHYWRKSRKGNPIVGRKTESSRLSRTLIAIKEWCKKKRHEPIAEQHKTLILKIKGHYNYYGINNNIRCLSNFLFNVTRIWRKWLDRRNRNRKLNWEKMREKILNNFPLPRPYILHSDV